MHCHLGKLLAGGGSAAGSVSESPAHLDWLPQVCGEQDDRWMEALLCLLEIFIHAQSLLVLEKKQNNIPLFLCMYNGFLILLPK